MHRCSKSSLFAWGQIAGEEPDGLFDELKLQRVTEMLEHLSHQWCASMNANYRQSATMEQVRRYLPCLVRVLVNDPLEPNLKKKIKQSINGEGVLSAHTSQQQYALAVRSAFQCENKNNRVLIKNLSSAKMMWIDDQDFIIQMSYNLPNFRQVGLNSSYLLDVSEQYLELERKNLFEFIHNYFYFNYFVNHQGPLIDLKQQLLLQVAMRSFPVKKEDLEYLRCKHCDYILGKFPAIQCCLCQSYFHSFCIQSQLQQDITFWFCQKCYECQRCQAKIKSDKDLIKCCECKQQYHRKCAFFQPAAHSASLDARQQPGQKVLRWYCEHCIKCTMCGTKIDNQNDGHSI